MAAMATLPALRGQSPAHPLRLEQTDLLSPCQTGGKLLRIVRSAALRQDWPRTLKNWKNAAEPRQVASHRIRKRNNQYCLA